MFYIAPPPVRVLQWPAGSQPNIKRIGSYSTTMDIAPRVSVSYLVSTANGGNEQEKHCKSFWLEKQVKLKSVQRLTK